MFTTEHDVLGIYDENNQAVLLRSDNQDTLNLMSHISNYWCSIIVQIFTIILQ